MLHPPKKNNDFSGATVQPKRPSVHEFSSFGLPALHREMCPPAGCKGFNRGSVSFLNKYYVCFISYGYFYG